MYWHSDASRHQHLICKQVDHLESGFLSQTKHPKIVKDENPRLHCCVLFSWGTSNRLLKAASSFDAIVSNTHIWSRGATWPTWSWRSRCREVLASAWWALRARTAASSASSSKRFNQEAWLTGMLRLNVPSFREPWEHWETSKLIKILLQQSLSSRRFWFFFTFG